MRRRKVIAWHFYGTFGDPGYTGNRRAGSTVKAFYGEKAWDRAVHFATDRMRRPIVDDDHPGRVMVRDVTPVFPRAVNQALWVGPDEDIPGAFTFEWRQPDIWGATA